MTDGNDPGNPSSSNDKTRPKLKLTEDAKVFKQFAEIFRDKFNSLSNSDRLREAYEGPNGKDFMGERSLARRLNGSGLTWGVASGVAIFALLRRGPRAIVTFWARRRGGGGGGSGYRFDRGVPRSNPFDRQQAAGGATAAGGGGVGNGTGGKRPGRILFNAVGLCVDLFLSFWGAAAITSVLTDGEVIREGISSLPLVEGRSIAAEELCDDFMKEYRAVPKEFWRKEHVDYPSVVYIEKFVKNCEKRRAYEKRLRKEMGLRRDEPVVIPPPGVPNNYTVESDDLDESMVNDNEDDNDEFTSFEGGFNDQMMGANADFSDDKDVEQWSSFDDFEGGDGKKEETNDDAKKRRRWW